MNFIMEIQSEYSKFLKIFRQIAKMNGKYLRWSFEEEAFSSHRLYRAESLLRVLRMIERFQYKSVFTRGQALGKLDSSEKCAAFSRTVRFPSDGTYIIEKPEMTELLNILRFTLEVSEPQDGGAEHLKFRQTLPKLISYALDGNNYVNRMKFEEKISPNGKAWLIEEFEESH